MTISEAQLLKELTQEDLQEQHKEFAEVIGMDKLIALSKHFGGSSIYIPQIPELVKLRVYGMIKQEYKEGNINIKKLAIKYGVSESTVYNVVRDILMRGSDKRDVKVNIPGQITIMDCLNGL